MVSRRMEGGCSTRVQSLEYISYAYVRNDRQIDIVHTSMHDEDPLAEPLGRPKLDQLEPHA